MNTLVISATHTHIYLSIYIYIICAVVSEYFLFLIYIFWDMNIHPLVWSSPRHDHSAIYRNAAMAGPSDDPESPSADDATCRPFRKKHGEPPRFG